MRKRKPKQPHSAIRRMVQKLKLQPNNILMIKKGTKLAQQDMIEEMGKMFEEHYDFHIVFVVVDEFDDLQILDEAAMLENGWINIDSVTEEVLHANNLVRWPVIRKSKDE